MSGKGRGKPACRRKVTSRRAREGPRDTAPRLSAFNGAMPERLWLGQIKALAWDARVAISPRLPHLGTEPLKWQLGSSRRGPPRPDDSRGAPAGSREAFGLGCCWQSKAPRRPAAAVAPEREWVPRFQRKMCQVHRVPTFDPHLAPSKVREIDSKSWAFVAAMNTQASPWAPLLSAQRLPGQGYLEPRELRGRQGVSGVAERHLSRRPCEHRSHDLCLQPAPALKLGLEFTAPARRLRPHVADSPGPLRSGRLGRAPWQRGRPALQSTTPLLFEAGAGGGGAGGGARGEEAEEGRGRGRRRGRRRRQA